MNNNNQLLEQILEHDNMHLAIKQVKKNKGSAGIDGHNTDVLDRFKKNENLHNLITSILCGEYKPSPVKIVEIPKDDGGVRMLGIPTVYDRVVQQAINQILTKIFDTQFSNYSYGFRPQKSAHDALIQAEKYVNEGREYIVDIDLSKYFDTINRDKLMYLLTRQISDSRVLNLISKFLKAGMLRGATLELNKRGVPQGSPLSPLLSNIYLDVLDEELEKRGVKFCRYADDIQIYATSLRGAYRQMESTITFLESKKLKLKVNTSKSAVKTLEESKFLGYSFRRNKETNEIELTIHWKALRKFKDKVRIILSRNRGISISEFIKQLNQITRGWINYFMLGLKEYVVKSLDGWIRRKIRVILWKQWKKSKKRRAMLYDYCNSIKHPNPNLISWLCRNGNRYWYVSHKLNIYISIADIRKLGFKELEQSLLKIKESRRYAELFNIRYS